MKRLFSIAALGSLLTALVFLAVAPVWAEDGSNVDQRIKALEQELNQLKGQQMELKKDAVAAAAAMPDFSYRPGNGMMINAADKSWSIRFGLESHFRTDFEAGVASAGRTDGEVMGRRFRPYIWYCINNCFTEIEVGWDMDGFGTGNAKNSTNTKGSSIMQRGSVYFHFEKMNPWLPEFQFGMDNTGNAVIPYRQLDGSTVGPFEEYDLVSHNTGYNTGRDGTGYRFTWANLPLSGVGIPGRVSKLTWAMGSFGEGDDGLSSFKNIGHGFSVGTQIEPFTQLKNKWLSGWGYAFNVAFCNAQKKTLAGTPENGCDHNRVKDDGSNGRQTLFDSGALAGKGTQVIVSPGIGWHVGPYGFGAQLNFINYGNTQEDGKAIGQRARGFRIEHELWLWSPKGPLTGSYNTTGSVLAAFSFDRGDWWCGHTSGLTPCAAGSQFSRERVLLREWDLWYYLGPRHSIGIGWQWYDASNLQTGYGNAGANLHVIDPRCTTCSGQGGSWTDVMLNWRYWF